MLGRHFLNSRKDRRKALKTERRKDVYTLYISPCGAHVISVWRIKSWKVYLDIKVWYIERQMGLCFILIMKEISCFLAIFLSISLFLTLLLSIDFLYDLQESLNLLESMINLKYYQIYQQNSPLYASIY